MANGVGSTEKRETNMRFFLNRLRSDPHLATPNRGAWKNVAEFLRDYASAIDLGGQLSNEDSVHSAPSAYQRPIVFYQALADASSPIHHAIRSQWRGLMALLGLSKWMNFDLKFDLLHVEDVAPEAFSQVGKRPVGDLHFRAIMRNQRPMRRLPDGHGAIQEVSDWDKFWLIHFGDSAIGASSPWTIVYTGAQPKCPRSVPWQRDGVLDDPLQHLDPNRTGRCFELSILHKWISDMVDRKKFWKFPAHLEEQQAVIVKRLMEWKEELEPYAPPQHVTFTFGDPIFSDVAASGVLVSIATDDITDSDISLNAGTRKGTGTLVLSGQMRGRFRVAAGDFTDGYNVASLKPEGELTVGTGSRKVPYIVPEKLFFPAKLLRLPRDSNTRKLGAADISLPLTPAFFRYFSEEDLERVKLESLGTGYRAMLTLPLNGTTLTVTRDYGRDDIIELPFMMNGEAAFTIWPDRYDPTWKFGFAAYLAPTSNTGLIVNVLRPGGVQSTSVAGDDKGQNEVRIWSCPEIPLGFALKYRPDKEDALDAGLMIREKPKPLPSPTQTFDVAVDFGTSSTMVMTRQPHMPPQPMRFTRHLVVLAGTPDRVDEIASNLCPAVAATAPFRTLLLQANATLLDFKEDPAPYALQFSANDNLLLRCVDNVKWSPDSSTNTVHNPMMAYLRSLIRLIVWELKVQGAQSISFFWSYPRSLPPDTQTIMRDFWSTVGKYSTHDLEVREAGEASESAAACHAFIGAGATVSGDATTIVVDVGGGSSDIAFWCQNKLVDQLSFKLAGNDILPLELFQQPEAIEALYKVCYGQSGADINLLKLRPHIYINNALTQGTDREPGAASDPNLHPVPSYLGEHGVAGQAPWVQIRSMIYVFYTGLAFYLGIHSRSLPTLTPPRFTVYFGGRGSSLLTWMPNHGRALIPALQRAFRAGFGNLAGLAPENAISAQMAKQAILDFHARAFERDARLPDLKLEVAKGLLLGGTLQEDETPAGTLAGEIGFTMDQIPVPWSHRLNPEDFSRLTVPPNFQTSYIDAYRTDLLGSENDDQLESLNLRAEKKRLHSLELDDELFKHIFREEVRKPNAATQPIFAYELAALMRGYSRMVQQGSGTAP